MVTLVSHRKDAKGAKKRSLKLGGLSLRGAEGNEASPYVTDVLNNGGCFAALAIRSRFPASFPRKRESSVLKRSHWVRAFAGTTEIQFHPKKYRSTHSLPVSFAPFAPLR
jgi:hypothetical protein